MNETNHKRHIIALLLENEAGALCRVANLFSARGFNIESLTVAPTEDPTLSRMTLVTWGTDEIIEQIIKQLNKLIDVVKLVDLSEGAHIEGEMMMAKIKAEGDLRAETYRLVEIFGGRILDVTDSTYVIELTGDSEKIDRFLKVLDPDHILEVVRSGVIAIARAQKALHA